MAFLMLSSQKSLLTMKKNELQFNWSCKLNQVQNMKKRETDHTKRQNEIVNAWNADPANAENQIEWDMDTDPVYQALMKEEELLTIEADSYQQQIQVIDQEIAALKQTVSTDIKQATQLSLLGGS